MEFDAEFYILLAFLVFACILFYLGAHRIVLKGLDARGEAINEELAQAAKLRAEAVALRESFGKKAVEAEAQAAAIIAEARAQTERFAVEAETRISEFVARRMKQAESKIAFAEAQAAAEVRAAVVEHAARAAEIVLRVEAQGATGAEIIGREIADLKSRLN
jgi:F-type H+-transporting ATPase subunit b